MFEDQRLCPGAGERDARTRAPRAGGDGFDAAEPVLGVTHDAADREGRGVAVGRVQGYRPVGEFIGRVAAGLVDEVDGLDREVIPADLSVEVAADPEFQS